MAIATVQVGELTGAQMSLDNSLCKGSTNHRNQPYGGKL